MLNLEIAKESMHKFATERKKAKGNKGESTPAASESLVAVQSAYEKAVQALRSKGL